MGKHPTRRRLEQFGWSVGSRLAHLLGRRLSLRALQRVADAFACMVMAGGPRRQRLADANIAAAFPELSVAERQRVRRRSVQNVARTMVELFKLPYLSKEEVAALVVAPDSEPLRQALSAGGGVLMISAHYGNWELLGAYLSGQVAPVTVVARDATDEVVASLINEARASHGVRVVGRRDTRQMLRVLNAGGLLGVLPDQYPAEGGAFMEFLGRPTWVFTGPAVLASRTACRVFPVFCVRDFNGPFRLEILPEVELVHSEDRQEDIVENTRRTSAVIEQMIRAHPDNWLWLHNRWKTSRRPAPTGPDVS